MIYFSISYTFCTIIIIYNNMDSQQVIYELCQFNNLKLDYSTTRIGGRCHCPLHKCILTIKNTENELDVFFAIVKLAPFIAI